MRGENNRDFFNEIGVKIGTESGYFTLKRVEPVFLMKIKTDLPRERCGAFMDPYSSRT